MHSGKHRFASFLIALFLFLGTFFFFISFWSSYSFGEVTIDTIVFHLKVPLQGTNTSLFRSFFLEVLLPTLVLCVGGYAFIRLEAALHTAVLQKAHKRVILELRPRFPGKAGTAYRCPAYLIPRLKRGFCLLLALLFCGFELIHLAQQYSLPAYIEAQRNPSTWIEEHYVSPTDTSLTWPEEKRNLIYIFLESMESTYASVADGGCYPENLIPELTELASENTHFTHQSSGLGGAHTIANTSWTIAGLFAQTSGLPLKLPLSGNRWVTSTSFLPGVTALGDILEDAGYRSCLMIGSDGDFGGRKDYFSQHGSYEVLDYNWALETGRIPEDYYVFWGFEDSRLFEMAKEKLTELASTEEPFNFTLLTVDSHFPDGYRCESCLYEHSTDYQDAISCSSRQVYNLVRWIQQQDFYENTTIIISGDHLSMAEEVSKFSTDSRSIYNCILNAAAEPSRTTGRQFTTMDMFPTTLAALGVTIEGDRLALGTNLFSEKETLAEEYGYDTFQQEISKRSEFFNSLMY